MVKKLPIIILLVLQFFLIGSVGWGQSISVISGSLNLCTGLSVTLKADNTITPTPRYQWDSLSNNNWIHIINDTNQIFTTNKAGNYSVLINNVRVDSVIVVSVLAPVADFTFTPDNSCSNVPIVFTNTSTGNGLSYAWNFANSTSGSNNTSTQQNPIHTFITSFGSGTQSFIVQLITTNNFSCKDTIEKTVTIKQRPNAQILGPSPTTINDLNYFRQCTSASSATLDFINKSSTSATNTNYQIIWGDGSSDFLSPTFNTTISHTYNTGSYTLKFIVTGNGCIDTATYFVYVGSNPAVGLSNPGNTAICTSTSLTFPITNAANNSIGTTYKVSFSDGTTPFTFSQPPPTSITHQFNLSSCGYNTALFSNSFSATIQASNPCGSSAGSIEPIYVSQKPTANFLISPKDTVCSNTIVVLKNTTSNNNYIDNQSCINGKSVWIISPNTGYTITSGSLGNDYSSNNSSFWDSGSVNIQIKFTSPGTYSIKLRVGNTNCGIDDSVRTICVNDIPTTAFSVIDTTGCAPFNVIANNSTNLPNCGINYYTWSVTYTAINGCLPNTSSFNFTGGTNASSTNPQFQFINPGKYTISLNASSVLNSCSSLAVTKQILVKGKPTVSTITATTPICQFDSIKPTVTVGNCNSSTIATYNWSFPRGTPISSTNATPTITYNTNGNDTISLGVTNECGTSIVTKPIVINPTPIVTLPSNLILCAGTSTGLINFGSNISGTTYTWTNNNTAIGLASSGNGNSINSFTVSNSNNTPITATITVTPKYNNCIGAAKTFTITVNPKPTIPNFTSTICSNTSFSVNPTHNGTTTIIPTGTSYTWPLPISNPTNAITGGTAQSSGIAAPISQTLTNTTPNSATLTYIITPTSGADGSCVGSNFSYTVTVNSIPKIDSAVLKNPTACSASDGVINLYGLKPNTSYTVTYTKNNGAPITISPNPTSNTNGVITISNLSAGTYTNFSVTLNDCPSNIIAGPVTLSDPNPPATPIPIAVNPLCSGGSFNLCVSSPNSNAVYTWNGPGVNNQTTTSGCITVNNATATTGSVYSVSVKLNNCVSAVATDTVIVNPTPSKPTVVSPVTYCQGAAASVLTATLTVDTLLWYTSVTGGTGSTTAPTPSTTTAGTTTYYVSQKTNLNCESPRNSIEVVVNPTPSKPTVVSPVTYCQGATSSALTATPSMGNNLIWYNVSSGGTALSGAPTPITTTVGTSAYYVSQITNKNCEGPRDTIKVVVNATPLPPSVTTPVTYCQGTSASALTAILTADTLLWFTTATGGVGSTSAPTPSTNSVGTTTYYVSQKTNLSCEGPRNSIQVVINPTPSKPTVVSPVTYCQGATASALTATTSLGNNLIWYNVSSGGTALSGAPTPITTTVGTTAYYVSQINNKNCEGARDTIKVVVNAIPAIDSVNKNNPTNCASATGYINIYGTFTNSTYRVSYKKNGILINKNIIPLNNIIKIDTLQQGIYTDFSVSIFSCPSNIIAGPVILSDPNPPATPTVSSNGPICSGNTLSLNASSTTNGVSYTWTTNALSAYTSNAQNPTIGNVTTAYAGTYTITVTLNNCTSTNTVIVAIDSTPFKPKISSNSPLCYGSSIQLNSVTTYPGAPGTLSYLWTTNAPTSFISSIQNPIILNATELNSGLYILQLKSNSGNCLSDTMGVNVLVRPKITQAVVSGNDTIYVCNFSPPANASQNISANLDASRPFEKGKWSIISQPIGGNGSFANVGNASTSFNYSKSGLYQLQWAITNDLPCDSTRDTLYISVVDKTEITQNLTATATSVCAGNNVTISIPLNSITGIIKKWQYKKPYTALLWVDTSVISNNITFVNVQDTFKIRIVVVTTDTLHCSTDTAFKEIQINVAPSSYPGTTTGNQTVCTGSNSGAIQLSGNIGTPYWQYSTNGINFYTIIGANNQTYNYTNLTTTTWYRAAIKSGNCDTVFSNATKITVIPLVTPANAGLDTALCNANSYQLNANTPSTIESGLWSFVNGSATATITSFSNANSTITGLSSYNTYSLIWTLSNGVCPVRKDTVVIKNYLPLTNLIDTTTQTYCNGVTVTVTGIAASGGNTPYTYQWQMWNGTMWVDIVGANSMNYTFIASNTIKLRRLVKAQPCTDVSLEKIIYIQPPLANNSISGNAETCINTSSGTLIGSLPTGGDGTYFYQWQSSVDNINWITITGATNKDYTVPILTATTFYRRYVTSALCKNSQGLYSTVFVVTVRPDAKAQWQIINDTGCASFNINNTIVKPILYTLQNGSYSWFANNIFYGNNTSINPGYILANKGDSVNIKMVAISLYGCKNDSLEHKFYTIPSVLTAFTRSDSIGCGPLTVSFLNTTPNLNLFTYVWNFGNNQTSTLIQPNNVIFLTNPNFGDTTYNVKLTATSKCELVSIIKTVTVKSKPKSIFTPNKTIGCSPLTIVFSNLCKGLNMNYVWNFGDGSMPYLTSLASAVTHTFNSAVQDTFIVSLIASNTCGTDTSYYNVVITPNTIHLDFAVNGTEKQGCKPHTVKFYNATSGANNFQWNFGDGNVLNTTKNIDTITHTFLQAGNFTVSLLASNGCSDTTSTELIQVFNKPVANFSALPISACIGDTVRFINQSDTITSLLWNFKDGYTSTLTNPIHSFVNAGLYNVQLKAIRQYNNGLSCTDSVSKLITIVSKLPGLFTVSDSVSNCVPFTVTFTNQSLPSSLTVWYLEPNVTDTGNVITHTFTKVGTYSVKMVAKHPSGCTYEYIKNIIVRGPVGTWQYDYGNICKAIPVRFSANVTGTDSIKWDFGDNTFATTTGTTIYHNYNQPGYYIPKATLYSNLNNNCTVTLNGLDTIKIDEIKAGYRYANTLICGSTNVQFTDTTRHFFNIANWHWDFGDGTISNQQNPQHTYTISNSYTVKLTVTSASGCTDTVSKFIYVKVNNKPANSIAAPLTGCTQSIINYTGQVNSVDYVTNVNWIFSNGLNSTGYTASNMYLLPGNFTATLIASTIYGCIDSTKHTIIINPTPTVIASNNQMLCRGQSLQLNVTGANNYTWSPINGTLSCTICSNPIATPLTTTQYFVTGTTALGCSNADTVLITVAQPIDVVASANDTICIGSSSQLSAMGATTYLWSPALTLNLSNIATPIATPTLTTKYQVVGYDQYNCFQDTASVIVAVGKYPTINLGADKILATGTLLPLTSTITNGPLTKWLWTPATDLNCSTCPQPIATIKKQICYTLQASNMYHCEATDTLCIKVFCEGTQVFIPNGFTPDGDGINDILMVRGTGIKLVKNFRIFNRWGQVVFERNNFAPNDANAGWNGTFNGKPSLPDVYVYTCEVVCENDISYTYKGNVAIIK